MLEGRTFVVMVMAWLHTSLHIKGLLYRPFALVNCLYFSTHEVESMNVFKYLMTADEQVLLASTSCIPKAGGWLVLPYCYSLCFQWTESSDGFSLLT